MSQVAVIGAGPAGMAAAIQLSRSGRDVSIFEQNRLGGTIWNAGWVENYPGFPGGISGRHLARLMEEHLYQHIEAHIPDTVNSIKKTDAGYLVKGKEFQGVIICTGTVPKKAKFPGEAELEAAGKLFYGLEMEHWHDAQEIGIIGGGEASIDMAMSIAESGKTATIIHRSEPRAIKSLMDQALDEPKIIWQKGNVRDARLHEQKAVISLEDQELAFDFVIVAVGREKCLPELEGIDHENWPGGFFIAGDAVRGTLGQATMAVGDGVEAAMEMGRYLRRQKDEDY